MIFVDTQTSHTNMTFWHSENFLDWGWRIHQRAEPLIIILSFPSCDYVNMTCDTGGIIFLCRYPTQICNNKFGTGWF